MKKKIEMIPCKHKGNPKYASICLGDFEKTFTASRAPNIRCPPCRAARCKEEQEKNGRYFVKNIKKAKVQLLQDTKNRKPSNENKSTNSIELFTIEIRVSKNTN
jgi:hypothetical protein